MDGADEGGPGLLGNDGNQDEDTYVEGFPSPWPSPGGRGEKLPGGMSPRIPGLKPWASLKIPYEEIRD